MPSGESGFDTKPDLLPRLIFILRISTEVKCGAEDMLHKLASGTVQIAVCVPLALETSPSFSKSLLEGADAVGS